MKNTNGNAGLRNADSIGKTYTVEPELVEGCDCEDCRAGRHIYSLFRWTVEGWDWCATSLQSYSSAKECKEKHSWGIVFGPHAVWEDGQPVVEPDPTKEVRPNRAKPDANGMVPLDTKALMKSFEALERHWGKGR